MDDPIKAYLMSQGCYECALGGYPSKDSSNNVYNVFYGIRNKIGSGGFGVVHHADRYLAKPDGIRKDPHWPECAVKVLTLPSTSDPRAKDMSERIKRELEFNNNDRLHEKQHVVVPVRVHVTQNLPPLIVMEYCSGGDLAKYLTSCNQRRVSERLARRIISQVCSGLKEIRDEGFFHRDIKPANVFITNTTDDESKMTFKIGDFGLVARIGEDHRILCGTPANLAPEINGRNIYGPEVDVWSLGVLLYTILTGQVPFRGESDIDTIRRAREEMHHFPDPSVCPISDLAKDLINRMLQKHPKSRIVLDEILKHPFFSDYPYRQTPLQSSVFSNDSGFSSSNASASVGSSPVLRNAHFMPGKLQAVIEADTERFHRKDFSRAFQHSSPSTGPVVASFRPEQDLFQRSQSYNAPPPFQLHQQLSFEQIGSNTGAPHHQYGTNRYASSAPSLATNLSTASLQLAGSDPNCGALSSIPSSKPGTHSLAAPLSTNRLRPSTKKHNFRLGSGLIQEDGWVRLEFNIPSKKSNLSDFRKPSTVVETMLISSDGREIQVSRTNSPEFGVRRWRYEELPSKFWSKYNFAAKFVNLVRESTPKITIYTDNAIYRLMENGPPDANFEVQYYTGEKFIYSSSKSTWTSTGSTLYQDPTRHPDFQLFLIERDRVRHLEKLMEDLDREEDQLRLPGSRYKKFPLVMGKRPSSLSSLPKATKLAGPTESQSNSCTMQPQSAIISRANSPAKFLY